MSQDAPMKTSVLRHLLLATALLVPSSLLAQIQVLMSGGFAAPYAELLPAFEKASGMTVTTTRGASQGSGATAIPVQLRNGSTADVIIMSKEGLKEVMAENRIDVRSAVDLARTPLGVAVRAGAPKPDIRTVDAFKQTLLRAKSANLTSTTGIYLRETLFPKLGIAKEMAPKIKEGAIAVVTSGDAELSVRPVSEILNVPGVDFAGTVPDEIQFVSVFTAAITTSTKQPGAAKHLIEFLSSPEAAAAIRKSGMERVRGR